MFVSREAGAAGRGEGAAAYGGRGEGAAAYGGAGRAARPGPCAGACRGAGPAGIAAGPTAERQLAACEAMLDLSAALFNVSGKELRRPGRTGMAVTRVRQIAMYVSHVTLELSMNDVGRGFGRDRTTVLHACHLVEDLRDDPEFDGIVTVVERVAAAAFGLRRGE